MSPRNRAGRAGRLSRAHSWVAYITLLICSVSGLLYLYGSFAEEASRGFANHENLVVHGLSSLAALGVLGSVLPHHVRTAWRADRNRLWGSVSLVVMAVLSVSGAMLYYGGEESRDTTILAHWWAGLGLTLFFPLHVWLGRCRQCL